MKPLRYSRDASREGNQGSQGGVRNLDHKVRICSCEGDLQNQVCNLGVWNPIVTRLPSSLHPFLDLLALLQTISFVNDQNHLRLSCASSSSLPLSFSLPSSISI
ncbi:hypothetical protein SLA2020_059330 [Shorea laevis]